MIATFMFGGRTNARRLLQLLPPRREDVLSGLEFLWGSVSLPHVVARQVSGVGA